MKIAVPVTDTHVFSLHYGASTALACFEIDEATRRLRVVFELRPRDGSPCSWPAAMEREGISVLLVGGMGDGAKARCEALGIRVIAGVPDLPPAELVAAFLADTLAAGENACGDGGHDGEHAHEHSHGHGGHCGCAR